MGTVSSDEDLDDTIASWLKELKGSYRSELDDSEDDNELRELVYGACWGEELDVAEASEYSSVLGEAIRQANEKRTWIAEGYTLNSWDIAAMSDPDEDNRIVYSSNVSYLVPFKQPAAPHDARIFDDGMYGYDEVSKWPSVISKDRDIHLVCIPVAPIFRNNYEYAAFPKPFDTLDWSCLDILWETVGDDDFTPVLEAPADPEFPHGSLGRKADFLDQTSSYIKTLIKKLEDAQIIPPKRLSTLLTSLQAYIVRLDETLVILRFCHIPFVEALCRAREAQRVMLEMLGQLIFHSIISKTFISSSSSPPSLVFPCIGGFAAKLSEVALLHRSGIPVWHCMKAIRITDQMRVFNSHQPLLEIKNLLSLTEFSSHDAKRFELKTNFLNKADISSEMSSLAYARDVPRPVSGYQLSLLPLQDDSLVELDFELLLIDWMIKVSGSTFANEDDSFKYPFGKKAKRNTGNLLTFTKYLWKPPSRYTANAKRQKFPTFKDLVTEITVREGSVVYQPIVHAAELLYEQTAPWPVVPAALYAFPPPSLFLRSNVELPYRILRWLRMRSFWTSSFLAGLEPGIVEPLPAAVWRALLSAETQTQSAAVKSGRLQRKFKTRVKVIDRALEKVKDLPMLQISDKSTMTAHWGESLFDREALVHRHDIHDEVVYELHQLNFIADFLSLDSVEMRQLDDDGLALRRHRFMQIFGGEPLLSPKSRHYPDVWCMPPVQRFQYLKPWFNLMQDWNNVSPSLKTVPSLTTNVSRLQAQQSTFENFERNMMNMFVARFLLKFHRWPVVPMHRPASLEFAWRDNRLF